MSWRYTISIRKFRIHAVFAHEALEGVNECYMYLLSVEGIVGSVDQEVEVEVFAAALFAFATRGQRQESIAI